MVTQYFKTSLRKCTKTASVNIWKDSVIYDELTMNGISDAEFEHNASCVRRGCPTEKIITTLEQHIINVCEADKFSELQQLGQAPVCLFPTRQMCKTFNNEMLQQLTT